MKSKDLIEYLNSIDATVKTKHEEFKIGKYNLSVVLFDITTTTSKDRDKKYKVNIIANRDDSNISWNNIRCKFFSNEMKATKYYNNLIKFILESDVNDIQYILEDK